MKPVTNPPKKYLLIKFSLYDVDVVTGAPKPNLSFSITKTTAIIFISPKESPPISITNQHNYLNMAYRAAVINEETKIDQAYEAIRRIFSINDSPLSLCSDELVTERKKIDTAYYIIDGLFAASYEAMKLWRAGDKLRRDSKLNDDFDADMKAAADIITTENAKVVATNEAIIKLAAETKLINEAEMTAAADIIATKNAEVVATNKAIMDRRDAQVRYLNLKLADESQNRINAMVDAHCDSFRSHV